MKPDILKSAFSKISIITVIMWSIIAVPFLLGKYCELNTPGVFDCGAYVYSAEHILRGAKIGVDEIPTAKVGTLLVNMLGVKMFGFSDIGPKLLQGVMQAAALLLIFLGIKRHFGRLAAFVSTLVASIYISAPVIAKFGNVKEQFLISCVGISIGAFFLYYNGGKRSWAVLSGAAMAMAPAFKETGVSITLAMITFLAVSAILRWKKLSEVLKEAGLILLGAVIVLAPLHIWLAAGDVPMSGPYSFIKGYAAKMLPSGRPAETKAQNGTDAPQVKSGDYLEGSRSLMGLEKQAPVVFRYYRGLILPIFLALISIIAAKYRTAVELFCKKKKFNMEAADRLVFLPAACWVFDMLFVWISPRSYEEYYIPMTMSGAITGGYIVWLYARSASRSSGSGRGLWYGGGAVAVIAMVCMSWNVFAGYDSTFHSGQKYGGGERRNGYAQRLKQAADHRAGKLAPWEVAAEYVKRNSAETDTMYVWGWYPGIYVEAQRLSCFNKAFESEMHVKTPQTIAALAKDLVSSFDKNEPLFLVDSRKMHFPWNRPQLELWPSTPKGFLPDTQAIVAGYEAQYYKMLAENIDKDEAQRFAAMAPLRKYVRDNYYIVDKENYRFVSGRIYHPKLGEHVIFKRKTQGN